MKKIILLLTIVVIIPMFCIKISASDVLDEYINDFENITSNDLGIGAADTDRLLEMASFRSIFNGVLEAVLQNGGRVFKFFLSLLGALMLMSVSSFCHDRLSSYVERAIGIICTVVIFEPLHELVVTVGEALLALSDFFSSLTPIAVGITALGGGVAGANVQAVGMYTTLSAVSSLCTKIFSVINGFGMAVCVLTCLGSDGASSVFRGVKELFSRVSGIFTALITAAFSLQTLIASAADSASIRAVKYAASGLIPVVGSTVSGAISTLAAGIAYAKGIVGGGAIIVILYLALSPLCLLLMYRLSLSVSMIAADFVGISGAGKILSSYRFVIDMALTAYALSALIYLFEIIVFIRMGVTLL